MEGMDWTSNSDPFNIFASRGMSAPKIMPPAEVKRETRDRAARIFANYSLLKSIVERHDATLQKRWEKRTRTQRLAILLEGWPDMPSTHRPDFAAFRKNAKNLNKIAVQNRSAFVWPMINQEDLGEPRTLSLLLNARGRTHPNEFAAADGEAMHLGKVTMAIVPIFLNEHVLLLNGITRQEDYGKLLKWDEHEDAFDWMHTRKQFLPGEGLLILEFQDRLLAFLVHCCKKILHDMTLEQMTSGPVAINSAPESSIKSSVDASGFSSLAVMAKEAPYRAPAKLDLERIESLLAARTTRAEDNVWALREDPSYFAETLFDLKEHRSEMIKDSRGDVHPTLKPGHQDLLWTRIVGNVLVESFFQLESFTELRDQAGRLRTLQTKYESKILPGKDLPEEYLNALLKFHHYLKQVSKGAMNQLQTAVAASPPLRNLFVRSPPPSATSTMMEIMSKSNTRKDSVTEHLMWLLQTLWEDGQNLFLCRMTTVMDELDRLLKSDPKAAELVSPYIAMLLGELSIVGECLRQLEIYQPWANTFENALVEKETGIKTEFARRTQSWGTVLEAFRDQNLLRLAHLTDPSGGRFQYPVGKRLNKANVESLRVAESHLDDFWAAIDDILRRKVSGLNRTAYGQLLTQARNLQRTPEWVEPIGKKDQKPKGDGAADAEASTLANSLAQFHLGPETSASARKEALAAANAKTKIKSRGVPGILQNPSLDTSEPALSTSSSSLDVQPTFAVDARALKVFRLVFFDPAANTTAGEVAWRDFLHAMECTGFAAQKLYGSVWHFRPTRLDVERSIQFHEPHPRPKIPFLVARRHGRRLNRAYGWFGNMFVLKDKATDGTNKA